MVLDGAQLFKTGRKLLFAAKASLLAK